MTQNELEKQINAELRRTKQLIKRFSKKKNPRLFIENVNSLQCRVNDMFFELMLEDIYVFKKLSHKQDDFNSFVDTCWEYSQGDTRIAI